MSRKMTIHKNKAHPADALWWKPFFNMQREMNKNLSRMAPPFVPPTAWLGEQDLFESFQQNIHRVFSESFNMRQMLTPWLTGSQTEPYVDILENEEEFKVYADVPGLDIDDIDVSIADCALVIEGRKERHKSADGERYIHRECCTKPFKRIVALPENADLDESSVSFKHNVLIIDVPKKGPKSTYKNRKLDVADKSTKTAAASQKKKAA